MVSYHQTRETLSRGLDVKLLQPYFPTPTRRKKISRKKESYPDIGWKFLHTACQEYDQETDISGRPLKKKFVDLTEYDDEDALLGE